MTTDKQAPAIRTIIIRLTIGSFSIAALMGIFALLKGGEFSETQGNVLMTTLLVGVVSIAILCYLTTAGTPSQPVGILGGIVVPIPTVLCLVLIWFNDGTGNDWLWKALGVSTTLAVSLAHVCLLLSLTRRSSAGVRKVLYATLAAITVVAAMIIVPIIIEDGFGDWYWRIFGVIAILDVLGTVTVAAMAKFGSDDGARDHALRITPAMDLRLVDAAQRSGRSKSEIVEEALDAFLVRSDAGRP